MNPIRRVFSLVMRNSILLLLPLALIPAAALAADQGDFHPKRETYICPNVATIGVDCFLDAVDHLYTMCRNVKSIEIIEFGYEAAEEGVNGAKSDSCADKHKLSIAKPLQAALRESSKNRVAADAIKGLHSLWLQSLAELKWQRPETDQEYKDRVAKPYDVFHERASLVRTALAANAPVKKSPVTRANRTANTGATAKHGAN